MKTISKLLTTCTLLISGALVSFGAADMNTPTPASKNADMKAKAANMRDKAADMKKSDISEKDYKDTLRSMDVEDFEKNVKAKIKTSPRLQAFVDRVKLNNKTLAKEIKTFLDANKDKQLKDLDQTKLKDFLKQIWGAIKEKQANEIGRPALKNGAKANGTKAAPKSEAKPKTSAY